MASEQSLVYRVILWQKRKKKIVILLKLYGSPSYFVEEINGTHHICGNITIITFFYGNWEKKRKAAMSSDYNKTRTLVANHSKKLMAVLRTLAPCAVFRETD